jgi:hypothetical protein
MFVLGRYRWRLNYQNSDRNSMKNQGTEHDGKAVAGECRQLLSYCAHICSAQPI